MGTRVPHNYANFLMRAFERKYIYSPKYYQHIWFYCRYINNLFFIWTVTTGEYEWFYRYFSPQDDKVYTETFKEQIAFLGKTITLEEDGTIKTEIFKKKKKKKKKKK